MVSTEGDTNPSDVPVYFQLFLSIYSLILKLMAVLGAVVPKLLLLHPVAPPRPLQVSSGDIYPLPMIKGNSGHSGFPSVHVVYFASTAIRSSVLGFQLNIEQRIWPSMAVWFHTPPSLVQYYTDSVIVMLRANASCHCSENMSAFEFGQDKIYLC